MCVFSSPVVSENQVNVWTELAFVSFVEANSHIRDGLRSAIFKSILSHELHFLKFVFQKRLAENSKQDFAVGSPALSCGFTFIKCLSHIRICCIHRDARNASAAVLEISLTFRFCTLLIMMPFFISICHPFWHEAPVRTKFTELSLCDVQVDSDPFQVHAEEVLCVRADCFNNMR